MKVLVIQLARLGDIFLTWPTIRALRRKYPAAQIDLLVRRTYEEATQGLGEISNVRLLDSQFILEPLVRGEVEVDLAVGRVAKWVESLEAEKYDEIINLSFSPLSSYLARRLHSVDSVLRGYTRHQDGTFNPNDDVGAYFYAQVGPNGANRVHLTKIFAGLAGVELEGDDWEYRAGEDSQEDSISAHLSQFSDGSIIIHVGASQSDKGLKPGKWANVIVRLLRSEPGPILLVGDQHEVAIGEEIMATVGHPQVHNLVGMTRLTDLFQLMQRARLLIGCDSAPVHMASLVGLPTLNISLPAVSFWETGPRAEGSWVIWAPSGDEVGSDKIASEAMAMLSGEPPQPPIILANDSIAGYELLGFNADDFAWDLVKALYLKEPLPAIKESVTWQGIENLHSMNLVCLEQLQSLKSDPRNPTALTILEAGDRVFSLVYKMVPDLRPLIQWYRTEKIRLGPGRFDDILLKTEEIHHQLAIVTQGFLQYGGLEQQEVGSGRIGLE